MKILLVQARFTENYGITNPPLGLLYISSYLKAHGYDDIRVLHLDAMPPGEEELRRTLTSYSPELVGIGALTAQAVSMGRIGATVKSLLPGCLVVAGGPHPTHYGDRCMEDPNLDLVVSGEGEAPFLEIVRAWEGGGGFEQIAGLKLRRGGAVIDTGPGLFTPDLDELPMPDWGALDHGIYQELVPCSIFAHGARHMPLMTSRGCPYECTYCHKVMGRRFRGHSAGRVLEEIRTLYDEYGVRIIEVMDDNVGCDRERFKEILRGLARREQPDLQVYLAGGLHAETLDEEIIDLMEAAGIPYFAIGIETGSPRMQRVIKKNLDLERVRSLIDYAASKGMFVHGLFMIGIPGETARDILRSIEFACGSRLHTMLLATCFVYRGTELGRALGEDALMREADDVNHYGGYDGFSVYAGVDRRLLRLLKFLMSVRFYYDPRRVWRILRDLPRVSPQLLGVLLEKLVRRTIPF